MKRSTEDELSADRKSEGRTIAEWELKGLFPSLSIIVLNYKAEDSTARCLWSVANCHYRGPIEIILVDNGSTPSSFATLRALVEALPCRTKFIPLEENAGFTGGVLAAWPHAKGELICLLNNDALVHPACFTQLTEKLRGRPEIGAVWPYDAPLSWHDDLRIPRVADLAALKNGTHSVIGSNVWLPLLRDYRQCFSGSGVCMLFAKQDVRFPFPQEYFAYFEDVFLGWKLQLKGLQVERVPEAVIYHAGSATASRHPKLRTVLAFHAEKNRLANLFVFYSLLTLLQVLPLLCIAELTNLAGSIGAVLTANHRMTRLRAYWGSRIWLIRHARWLVRLRRQLQTERRVRDQEIICLLSGRLTMRTGLWSRLLNAISLTYCRFVGLQTVELVAPRQEHS